MANFDKSSSDFFSDPLQFSYMSHISVNCGPSCCQNSNVLTSKFHLSQNEDSRLLVPSVYSLAQSNSESYSEITRTETYPSPANSYLEKNEAREHQFVVSSPGSEQQNHHFSFKRKSNICLSRENIMRTWTQKDDDDLIKLADQYKNDWKKISKRIIAMRKKKVTPNFLKNRYKEIAGDHIKKGVKFTHEEDLEIAKLFEVHQTQWTEIAKHFVDRTPVMIKNRYYSHIRRKGLLGDLVLEAQVKAKPYAQDDISDSNEPGSDDSNSDSLYIVGSEPFIGAVPIQFEENHLRSQAIFDSDHFIDDQRINQYSDEGLCSFNYNLFEDELRVRITDYSRFSENFQY